MNKQMVREEMNDREKKLKNTLKNSERFRAQILIFF